MLGQFDPDWTVAPGQILAEEILVQAHRELSEKTGISVERLTGILNGSEPITREDAEALHEVLGISAEFWLRLEEDYQEGKRKGKTPL